MINRNNLTIAIISLLTFINIFIILFGFTDIMWYQSLGVLGCLNAVISTVKFSQLKENSKVSGGKDE